MGPFIRYQNLTLTNESVFCLDENGNLKTTDSQATFSSFGGGAVVGYQWLFGDL